MQISTFTLISLAAPIVLYLYASYLLLGRNNKNNTPIIREVFPTTVGVVFSLASLWLVFDYGEMYQPLALWQGLGFSVRLDALSAIILTMIAILGFVIMRYSANYMDGDSRKSIFMARLATTIASVQLLVLSGNLVQLLVFWIITSVCLHYLLVFYRHRPQAIAAARKKFMVARIGDTSLFFAVIALYLTFGTGELSGIFAALATGEVSQAYVNIAAILLVVAALFKSAQFPTHGWLIEVVETPTPVSALLHAGLLNAGPFLMVRMSFLLAESTGASVLLIMAGGFTALLASVIYLTQPSIKVSLGYSSVAHMGFSLLLSGLGLYAAAILHIVAHSFYKAHAFLSSGSVIDQVRIQHIRQPKRLSYPLLIFFSIGAGVAVFTLSSLIWGLEWSGDFSIMFIGAVIIMGLSQFLVQVIDSKTTITVLARVLILTFVVSFSFLAFEEASRQLLQTQIPALTEPDLNIQISALVLLISFGLVVVIQLLAPGINKGQLAYRLGVHLRNGLYANVLFDRVIGSLKHEKFKWANLSVQEELRPQEDIPDIQTLSQEEGVVLANNHA